MNTERERIDMRSLKRLGTLAAMALVLGGCEDITNPIEEFGELAGPYVRFEQASAIGAPGSEVRVIFQLPTRVEEDVEVDFSFGGDAVFGQDFFVVDAEGNPRSDVTAAGGTANIEYRPNQTAFSRDTVIVFVPFDATDGRVLEVGITEAQTESGREVEAGILESFRTFELSIEGFVDVPTGTYAGVRTGDFGGSVQVTISKPAAPVVQDGIEFAFVISDITGAGDLFGATIPWAFNVTSGGNVLASPRSSQFASVTADVTGTYDFESETLDLDVTLTCCGGEGLTWQLSVAR